MANEITLVTNQQELEVEVSGPDPANRMFIVSAIGHIMTFATAGTTISEVQNVTWTILVGPELTHAQFIKAIAIATPTAVDTDISQLPSQAQWKVTGVDADFDDESGRTEVRIETTVSMAGGTQIMRSVAFQATILAAL